MKKLLLVLLIPFLLSCSKAKVEIGLNLEELKKSANRIQSEYLEELIYIFSSYDLTLFELVSIRSSTYYFFIESKNSFDRTDYALNIKPKLKEKGWHLVHEDEYSELYCNDKNQAIGITFPAYKKELEGIHGGKFTYQIYRKLAVTLHYTSDKTSLSCPD